MEYVAAGIAIVIMFITLALLESITAVFFGLLALICIWLGGAMYSQFGHMWFSIPVGIIFGLVAFPLYQHVQVSKLKKKQNKNPFE